MMDDIADIYGEQEEEAVPAPQIKPQIDTAYRGNFTEVVWEGKKLMVPNPEHVMLLERRLAIAENTVEQLRGEITRMRQTMRDHGNGMRILQRGLDAKVDRS